ncbi:OmpA family protein [Chitinophaga silvisoli]|uniref:OmpA family protein n=1 Tax=Chitinophaga silvisoli TaxID=2291814 RepID=A0A3E1P4S4_9BACT|nr:OmpA family protein [Chitinophaga silvisoli]RFM35167.1 OmpA family protein [Chitinophaga silvisoli]
MAFNLSKNNDPVPASKKNAWAFILFAVVVIGAAIWYFIPKKETGSIEVALPAAPAAPVAEPVHNPVPDTTTTSSSFLLAASFNKGTADPVSISEEVVNKIRQSHKITIYGYASSEGTLSVNLALAQERAESFKQYLVSKGIDPAMITAVGKGIDDPIASNDTETGRTQNRRVEVSIE